MQNVNIHWWKFCLPLRGCSHDHQTRQTIRCISRGAGKRVVGERRTATGDDNTNGILFDGIWPVSSYTERKSKKSFEPNPNLSGASLPWKHGVETQADKDTTRSIALPPLLHTFTYTTCVTTSKSPLLDWSCSSVMIWAVDIDRDILIIYI